ncbi:MAG TPA: sugar ABC transporter permease [Gaiellaceae bacterium]|jgi:multiple sugar transport system permease protein|nr:sugar ABC transporter permease [Gaiellaceae bacterium]
MATLAASAPGPRTRVRRWAAGFRSRETWAAYAFLSPWLVGFVIFTAGPMIASLVLSFTDYSVIGTTHWVGWDNYHQLVHDPKVATAMKTTLIYTAMVVPAHVFLALALAVLLSRVGRAAGFFRVVFFLPTMTPAVAVGILYLLLFNGDYGLVNGVVQMLHLGHGPYWEIDPNWVKPSLVIMQLWKVGASVVILLAALLGVPQHLYEASAMDGASAWRRFRDVTLPMISPALFFIVIINTISALQTFDEVYTAFFNANTPFGTDASLFYVIYLFQQAFSFFHMGYASALAWLLFLVIMVVTAIQIVGSRRFVYYEGAKR